VPRSCSELPLDEVTSTMMKQSLSWRLLQVSSFESRHNVVLPRRVDALGDYQVKSVAVGPCNMWCIGTKRLMKISLWVKHCGKYKKSEGERKYFDSERT
jgi:hypothetical protein